MPIINSESLQGLCAGDAIFSQILDLYGEPPNWQRLPGFETLCRIILEQQVSLESARAAYLQLQNRLDDWSPQAILDLSDAEMRTCYVSRQKNRYLKALARALLNGELDLEALPQLDEAAVRRELTKIVGIGPWTAEMYLIFCLEAPDIFPPGDIAAVNTVKELKQVHTKEEVTAVAANWAPYRTAATFTLWHYYLCKRGRSVVY